jgi:hypothetical protein
VGVDVKVRNRATSWIVDGTHDETLRRENTLFRADQIPVVMLVMQPRVGDFSFLQDAKQFNTMCSCFWRRGMSTGGTHEIPWAVGLIDRAH